MAQREGTLTIALRVPRPGPAKHRHYIRLIKQRVLKSVLKEVPVGAIKVEPKLNERLHHGKVPRVLTVQWKIRSVEHKGRNWEEAIIDER